MQIEKINNNKIKVIIDTSDLEKNNIDINNFMSDSIEHQELFLSILDLAEEKLDFHVNNSKLSIESLSIANNIFILTITKISNTFTNNSSNYVYCFESFDNISSIISYIDVKNLYYYNKKIYLVTSVTNKYNYIIEEFSISKTTSTLFELILSEYNNKS